MKINNYIHLVGSGDNGFSLTNPYDCNVYIINGGNSLALVDTGSGINPDWIVEQIKEDGLDPNLIDTILLTHAHADHAGGAHFFSDKFNATVYALPDTARFVSTPDLDSISLNAAIGSGMYPKNYQFHACRIEQILEGDTITVDKLEVQVINTPGHSDGHAGYMLNLDGNKMLFSGDLIFCLGRIALQSTWDCRIDMYKDSIYKIYEMGIDSLFPGHLTYILNGASRHLESAISDFEQLGIPRNLGN